MPSVFISYTHDTDEHMAAVLALADRLRSGAINCLIDQYVEAPLRGWPAWCAEQVQESDFVLVVCSETYLRRFNGKEIKGRGMGGVWEGFVITQQLYSSQMNNQKFIPIVLGAEQAEFIPVFLEGFTRYDVSADDGYERLYRRLTNQPFITLPPLGSEIEMPQRDARAASGKTRSEKQSTKQAQRNLPFPRNHFFTGRDRLLERIHQTLRTTGAAAVSGMAGQGKTQTAVEYAYRHKSDYLPILWARADSREALISSFAGLAFTLNLPEASTVEQPVAVAAVKAWLESNDGWLLILDNADEIDVVREFLPQVRNSCILLTTVQAATGAIAERVPIEDMEVDEGALFLFRRINRIPRDGKLEDAKESDRLTAAAISAELGGLPLALDQAGAFIEETYYSLPEYLELYRQEGAKIRANATRSLNEHPALSVTFSIAFQKVEQANDSAARLIQLCAFLAPSPIPEEIFVEGGAEIGEQFGAYAAKPFEFSQIIKHAVRLSLMHRNSDKKTLAIHRLVQAVLKDGMNELELRIWAERAVRLISRAVAKLDLDEPARFERLLPHIQACADLVSKFQFEFAEAAAMLERAGKYLFTRARITEAQPLCSKALEIREKVFGPYSLEVARSLDNLGLIDDYECKFSKAEEVFKRALAIHAVSETRDEEALATVLNNLGNCYFAQSRYGEAEPLYRRALSMRERLLRPDHRDRATSLNDLARLHEARGEYGEAEKLYEDSLQMREKLLGPEHEDVAISLSNLANLYSLQGQEEKALPLYHRALEIRQKALGENHPDVATSLNSLANYHYQRYEDDKAEELYRKALEIWENKLGKNHPATATGLANLGNLYSSNGRNDKAEELFRRALEICENSLGSSSLKTANTIELLANHLFSQNKWADAERLYLRVRKIRENSLGPNHRLVAATINNLAGIHYARGEYSDAQKLYTEALRIKEATLGADHLEVAFTLNNLAGVYSSQGRYQASEELHRRALAIWEKLRGPTHPHVAMSLNNLAASLVDQCRFAEAETLVSRALEIRRQKFGPAHADVLASLGTMATVWAGMGKDSEAEALFLRVLEQRQSGLHDSTATAETLHDLGAFYLKREKYREADVFFEKALAIRERELGREHILTAGTLLGLADLRLAEGEYERSKELFERALAICEERVDEEHPLMTMCRRGLSNTESRSWMAKSSATRS